MFENYYYNPTDYNQDPVKDRRDNEDGSDGWGGCIPTIIFALFWGIVLAVLLCGCRTHKPETVVVVRDSIRTEVRTETVIVHDTVPVALPDDSVGIVTADTTSRIQTSVAMSEASIRDGLLYHSIWNKPTVDVPVEHKETVRDSIVYKEKEVPVPYPVEVEVEKPLTWWQTTRLRFANVMLIALLAKAIIWLLKKRAWWLSILKKLT